MRYQAIMAATARGWIIAWTALLMLLVAALPDRAGAQTGDAAPVPVAAGGPGPYVRPYKPRHGPLTPEEMEIARRAWDYFTSFTQEKTGLANSVGRYPSTTLWDTASYVSGAVSAYGHHPEPQAVPG
jgi:hypothetical protein